MSEGDDNGRDDELEEVGDDVLGAEEHAARREEFRYKLEREAAARMYHLVDDGTGLKHLVRGIPEPEPELEEFGDDVLDAKDLIQKREEVFYKRELEKARRAALERFKLPEGFTKAQLEERFQTLREVASSDQVDQIKGDYEFLLSVVRSREEEAKD